MSVSSLSSDDRFLYLMNPVRGGGGESRVASHLFLSFSSILSRYQISMTERKRENGRPRRSTPLPE